MGLGQVELSPWGFVVVTLSYVLLGTFVLVTLYNHMLTDSDHRDTGLARALSCPQDDEQPGLI